MVMEELVVDMEQNLAWEAHMLQLEGSDKWIASQLAAHTDTALRSAEDGAASSLGGDRFAGRFS